MFPLLRRRRRKSVDESSQCSDNDDDSEYVEAPSEFYQSSSEWDVEARNSMDVCANIAEHASELQENERLTGEVDDDDDDSEEVVAVRMSKNKVLGG